MTKNNLLLVCTVFIWSGCNFHKTDLDTELLFSEKSVQVIDLNQTEYGTIKIERMNQFIPANPKVNNWHYRLGGLGWFAGIDVSKNGYTYIADYTELQVHVFNLHGEYLTSLGKRGRGPAEFSSISDIKIIDDQLHVLDPRQFKVSIFSSRSLTLVHERNVNLNRTPDRVQELELGHLYHNVIMTPSQNYLTGYMKYPRDGRKSSETYNIDRDRPLYYFISDSEGDLISDNELSLYDEEIVTADLSGRHLFNTFHLPFLNRSLISVSKESYIYTAWTDTALVKIHADRGNYLRGYYFPINRIELTRDEILRNKDFGSSNIQNLLLHADFPKFWPVFSELLVDDNDRLWVSIFTKQNEVEKSWFIINKSGELVSKFIWPKTKSIQLIKNNQIYVLETDLETGLQQIVRYQIEIEDG